jgi:hypothetical protein
MTSVLQERAVSLISYLYVDDVTADSLLEQRMRGMTDPAEQLSLVCHGDGGSITPWAALTDPRVAEIWALPYVAQWIGGVVPQRRAGETDDDFLPRARLELIHPRGMLRGGQTSLRIIAASFGATSIRVVERPGDDLWSADVLVKPSQIGSNAAALTAALNDPEVVAAGFETIVLISDAPLIDEGTVTIDSVAGTVTIDSATINDVT